MKYNYSGDFYSCRSSSTTHTTEISTENSSVGMMIFPDLDDYDELEDDKIEEEIKVKYDNRKRKELKIMFKEKTKKTRPSGSEIRDRVELKVIRDNKNEMYSKKKTYQGGRK